MRKLFRHAALVLMVLTMCLSLSGCDDFKEELKDVLAKPIEFACGKFPPSAEELSLTVNASELALLDGFENLRSVDFNNSTCYADIAAWAEAHPEIDVRCAVPLPNGDTVQMMVEKLDLSGLRPEQAAPMAEAMKLLPRLRQVDLGKSKGSAEDLTFDDLALLRAALPNVSFNCDAYAFYVLGQNVSLNDTELDLSAISSGDVDTALNLVSMMPKLEHIDLGQEGGSLKWEDVLRFQQIFPEIEQHYQFSLYGQTFNVDVEKMDFSFQPISDNGESLKKVLPYLIRCSYVDMDSCGISNERMAALQAEFPNVKLVWRVFFGPNYTLRTDAERLLASKPSAGGNLTAADLDAVRYCTDLKYFDVGHNLNIKHVDFLEPLTKLEIVILSMNDLENINGIRNSHNIEFLEVFHSKITDIECVRGMKSLRYLSIGNTLVTDISPVYDIPLVKLWIGCYTPVPAEQVAKMQELHPDCWIDTQVSGGGDGYWRYGNLNTWPWVFNDRYLLLRQQMGYDEQAYNFTWEDEKYMEHFG